MEHPTSSTATLKKSVVADTGVEGDAEAVAKTGAELRIRHLLAASHHAGYWLRRARFWWEGTRFYLPLAKMGARQHRSLYKYAERCRALLHIGTPIEIPPQRELPKPPAVLFNRGFYKRQWPRKMHTCRTWWEDYLKHGWEHRLNPHPLFDVHYYLTQNPDVAGAHIEPLTHYLQRGWEEGRNPHPYFDNDWYIAQNPEVLSMGISPLEHYLLHGWKNDRDPGPRFSIKTYRSLFPDSSASIEPLGEWLEETDDDHKGDRYCEYVHWPLTSLSDEPHPLKAPVGKIAIQIHAFYLDRLDLLLGYLRNLPARFDLLISTNTPEQACAIKAAVAEAGLDCGLDIRLAENRGRDVAPLVCLFGRKLLEYDYALHIHTKKSAGVKAELDYGAQWLFHNLECLVRTRGYIERIFALFQENPHCGVLAPIPWRRVRRGVAWTSNRPFADDLIARLGLPPTTLNSQPLMFPAGTMFWFRPKALTPLLDSDLTFNDFPPEPLPNDGSIAHAVERSILYIALTQGYHSLVIAPSIFQPE